MKHILLFRWHWAGGYKIRTICAGGNWSTMRAIKYLQTSTANSRGLKRVENTEYRVKS